MTHLANGIADFLGTAFLLGGAFLLISVCGWPAGIAFGVALAGVLFFLKLWKTSADANPAVTLGSVVAGESSFGSAIVRLIAQVPGAVAGTMVAVYYTTGSWALSGAGEYKMVAPASAYVAFCWEAGGVYFLTLTVCAVKSNKDLAFAVGPLAAGAVLGLFVTLAEKYSGGAINPLRAFFPALLSGDLSAVELAYFLKAYLISALVGCVLAGATAQVFKRATA